MQNGLFRPGGDLFGREKLAIEPATGLGFYRIGLNLRLVNMTALGASKGPMLEAGTRRDNALNRRAGMASWTARALRGTHGHGTDPGKGHNRLKL
jgi:hypothetical protein